MNHYSINLLNKRTNRPLTLIVTHTCYTQVMNTKNCYTKSISSHVHAVHCEGRSTHRLEGICIGNGADWARFDRDPTSLPPCSYDSRDSLHPGWFASCYNSRGCHTLVHCLDHYIGCRSQIVHAELSEHVLCVSYTVSQNIIHRNFNKR